MNARLFFAAALLLPLPLSADVYLRLPDSAAVPCLTDAAGDTYPMGVTMAQIFDNFSAFEPGIYAGFNAKGEESLSWGVNGEGTWKNPGGYAASITLCGRSAEHGETLALVLDASNSEWRQGTFVQNICFSGNGSESSAPGTGYTLGLALYDGAGNLVSSAVSAAGDARSFIPQSAELVFEAPRSWAEGDTLLAVVRGADKARLFADAPMFTVENLRISAAGAVPETGTAFFSLPLLLAVACRRRRG